MFSVFLSSDAIVDFGKIQGPVGYKLGVLDVGAAELVRQPVNRPLVQTLRLWQHGYSPRGRVET